MTNFTRVLTLACLSVCMLAGAEGAAESKWAIAVETASSKIAIDPSSGKQSSIKTPRVDGVVSPDGKRVAYTKALGAGDKSTRELCVAQLDKNGKPVQERQLTSGAGSAMQPQWLPDNKQIVYVRGEGKFQQVYLTNADNDKWSEKRVSAGGVRSFLPRVAPDGRIAYLVERGRDGKATLVDLVIVTDGKLETLVKSTPITEHAWSADGRKIAFSTHGELVFIDVGSGTRSSRKYVSRLNSFHATTLAWHPDGNAVAAAIHFSGGRVVTGQGEPEPLFGEREVFFIPASGEAKWFTVPARPTKVAWVKSGA